MKHIIFYIVVSILFVSVFSCKQRKNMQYLPFFYMKNYEVMHSKKYISLIPQHFDLTLFISS